MTEEKNNFAQNLYHLRQLDKLSKSDIAEIVNVSTSQITKIENGEVLNPSYLLIRALADFFGFTERELYDHDLTTVENNLIRSIQRIMTNIHRLDDRHTNSLDVNIEAANSYLRKSGKFNAKRLNSN